MAEKAIVQEEAKLGASMSEQPKKSGSYASSLMPPGASHDLSELNVDRKNSAFSQ